MFQRVCDRCGEVLKENMIQFGNKVSDWKGPETCFSIYGPDDPYKKQEGHFCKYCTEKFIDWIICRSNNDTTEKS